MSTDQEMQALESWDVDDGIDTPVEEVVEAPVEEVKVEEEKPEAPEFSSLLDSGDYKYEDGELLVKAKVSGKEDFYNIKDIKNDFAGKTDYTRKYTEFDKERKGFQAEKAQIEQYVNNFQEISKSENMVEAAKFLGQLSNVAPHEVVDQLINSLKPEMERRGMLEDSELQLEKRMADTQYQKELLESKQAKFDAEKRQSSLDNQIEQVMTNQNISSEEWDATVKELDAQLPADEIITPELVGQRFNANRANNQADSILSSYESGKYAANSDVVTVLRDIVREYPQLSQDDFVKILDDTLLPIQQQQLVDKVAKKTSTTNKQPDPEPEAVEVQSWDDII